MKPWYKVLNGNGIILVLFLAFAASGCASRYNITTSKGYKITAKGKPKYDKERGGWSYKGADGKPHTISTGSVTEVAPASMSP
jgi:hypothetical protein